MAMQDRVVNGFVVANFIPDGIGLSEGLLDQSFKTQYGGVGGGA